MARITARQAYSRARAEREKRPTRKRVARDARSRSYHLSQLVQEGLHIRGNTDSTDDDKSSVISSQSDIPKQIKKPNARRSKSVDNNRKITDYYSVALKGRENIMKTPIQAINRSQSKSPSPGSNSRIKSPTIRASTSSANIEVITLNDTDEEITSKEWSSSDHNYVSRANSLRGFSLSERKISFDNSKGSFEEDVEVVTMLPPIAQRDHPVFDLED